MNTGDPQLHNPTSPNLLQPTDRIICSPLQSSDAGATETALAALAARQETVLRQLEDLKNKLSCMTTVLQKTDAKSASTSAKPSSSTPKAAAASRLAPGPEGAPHYIVQELHRQKFNATAKPISAANLSDIVINANPATYLPYALRVIKSLWQDRIEVRVQTYTHSSIVRLPEEAVHFNELIRRQQAAKATAAATNG